MAARAACRAPSQRVDGGSSRRISGAIQKGVPTSGSRLLVDMPKSPSLARKDESTRMLAALRSEREGREGEGQGEGEGDSDGANLRDFV